MGRYKGKAIALSTYDVKYYGPYDTRFLVPTYADLTNEANWTINGYGSNAYNGMIVAVGSDTDVSKNGIYRLFDARNPGAKDVPDVTDEGNWFRVAELGHLKALADKIAELEKKVDSVTFETDETLSLKDGVLKVNTANTAEADNTLPITSAAVRTEIGNINVLLETI